MISAYNYVTGKSFKALPDDYLNAGKAQFDALKACGLTPEMTLLEIGCGCLLAGHFIVEYLNKGHYTAIEPNTWLVTAGNSHFNVQVTALSTVDFTAPGTFDFIFSHSVLSHASAKQLGQFMAAVKKQLKAGGTCLASLRLGPNSNYSEWHYPDPSFFAPATVEEEARKAELTLNFRPDLKKIMTDATAGEHHHDWIQLKL